MLKGIELLPHLYKQEVQARMQVFSSPRMPFDETKQCIVHLLLASYQLCRVVKVVIHCTAHAVLVLPRSIPMFAVLLLRRKEQEAFTASLCSCSGHHTYRPPSPSSSCAPPTCSQ